MMEKKLAEEIKKIEMPKEMRERILDNCDTKTEEMTMRKNNGKNLGGKTMVVAEGKQSTVASLVDGTVSVSVALPDVAAGSYKLVITELIGTKKADQPLKIQGEWECGFVK